MKYSIVAIQTKQSAKGNAYQTVTLKGEDGVHTEASSFDLAGKLVNDVVEGEVIKNGQYTNFKLAKPIGAYKGSGGGNFNKAMEKKAENIQTAQENKDVAIRLASSMNLAVQLAIAELSGTSDKASMAVRINHWRSWIIQNWGDLKDIKQPF